MAYMSDNSALHNAYSCFRTLGIRTHMTKSEVITFTNVTQAAHLQSFSAEMDESRPKLVAQKDKWRPPYTLDVEDHVLGK